MQVCKNAHILTINEKGLFLDDMNMRRVMDYKIVHGDMGPSLTITMDVIVGGDIKLEEAEAETVNINLDEAVRNEAMKSGEKMKEPYYKRLWGLPWVISAGALGVSAVALAFKIYLLCCG